MKFVAPPRAVSEAGVDALGSAIPDEAFSSLRFQALEDAAIWSRLWICVGFAADIPSPGDILPYTAGQHGIHIERIADGSVVGRFNKAQHGGCRVVPLQCRTGTRTRCSFTACGYSRDRRPILATDTSRELHLDQYFGLRPERLLPIPVRTYGPLLVTRLDPQGEAVCRWPVPEEISELDEGVYPGTTVWEEFRANWKNLMIAFAEGGGATTLFPNVVLRPVGVATLVAVLQPVALDRTLCRIRIFKSRGRAVDETTALFAMSELREQAGHAEARHGAPHHGASVPPREGELHARLHADIQAAIAALGSEAPVDSIFRTDAKDLW